MGNFLSEFLTCIEINYACLLGLVSGKQLESSLSAPWNIFIWWVARKVEILRFLKRMKKKQNNFPSLISVLNALVPAVWTALEDVSVNRLPDNTEVLWMSVVTSAFSSILLAWFLQRWSLPATTQCSGVPDLLVPMQQNTQEYWGGCAEFLRLDRAGLVSLWCRWSPWT